MSWMTDFKKIVTHLRDDTPAELSYLKQTQLKIKLANSALQQVCAAVHG